MYLEEMNTANVLIPAEVVYANLRVLVSNYASEGIADDEEAEAGHLGRVENQ